MSREDRIDQLRALVVPSEPTESNGPKSNLGWAKHRKKVAIALAASIVAASGVFASWVLWTDVLRESDEEPSAAAAPTSEATPTPTDSTAANGNDDARIDLFDDLRQLPVGTLRGVELSAIVRSRDATPLAAFVKVERGGRLAGVVLVDAVPGEMVEGPGVIGPEVVLAGGVLSTISNIGLDSAQLIEQFRPDAGFIRVSGFGTSATELTAITGAASDMLEPDGAISTALPAGWTPVEPFLSDAATPTWRAFYLGANGEIVVVAMSADTAATSSISDTHTCDGESTCDVLVTSIEDGVRIEVFASADRVGEIERSLRPVTATNAQVRAFEVEPFAEIDPSEATRLLYLPDDRTQWQIVETESYSSGRLIGEPALVLIERDTPEIGPITAAVVMQQVSDDAPARDVDNGPTAWLPTVKSGRRFELLGWNYTIQELALVDQLLSVDGDGLNFATRAGDSIGLERQFDDILLESVPRAVVEGPVFGATVQNSAGIAATIRVSRVAGFVPAAVAVRPHVNERVIVVVRGRAAGLIVTDDGATLEWEEQPGVLISLQGTSDAVLLQLARDLEAVGVEELGS